MRKIFYVGLALFVITPVLTTSGWGILIGMGLGAAIMWFVATNTEGDI